MNYIVAHRTVLDGIIWLLARCASGGVRNWTTDYTRYRL